MRGEGLTYSEGPQSDPTMRPHAPLHVSARLNSTLLALFIVRSSGSYLRPRSRFHVRCVDTQLQIHFHYPLIPEKFRYKFCRLLGLNVRPLPSNILSILRETPTLLPHLIVHFYCPSLASYRCLEETPRFYQLALITALLRLTPHSFAPISITFPILLNVPLRRKDKRSGRKNNH